MDISLTAGKRVYFLSDAHLGSPDAEQSRVREKKLVDWLQSIRGDAAAIFLLGDIFDFWFEYSQVVPKGFVRLLGKLGELSDQGIPIHYFTGNHDMWMYGYFEEEIGMTVHHDPVNLKVGDISFFIGHGDGLGPGDIGYKITKRIFKSRFARWIYARFHPNFGIGLASWLSKASRNHNGHKDNQFLGEDKEYLIAFAKDYESENEVDYFVFGHRHMPMEIDLPGGSRYVNLGDWIQHFSYADFDGNILQLKRFEL